MRSAERMRGEADDLEQVARVVSLRQERERYLEMAEKLRREAERLEAQDPPPRRAPRLSKIS